MKLETLLSQIPLGEDSTRQFKADVKNAESLASEMAAFTNMIGIALCGFVILGTRLSGLGISS